MAQRREPAGGFEGTLVVGRFLVAYFGRGGRSDLHSHHAVQIVVARDRPFVLTTAEGTRRVRVACIPAGDEHAFDASDGEIALVLVDRHHARGASLDAVVRGATAARAEAALDGIALPSSGPHEALHAAEGWVDALLGQVKPPARISHAVRRAIGYLEGAIAAHEKPSLEAAAADVGLSPTRLTHRFTAEVGAPFRVLVPWLRITKAVAEIARRDARLAERALTEAAYAAGFSDLGHMSRTFRNAFGLPPAAFFGSASVVSLADSLS
ncbi:MAG: AraC family transcriptional regulator [Polyangiaceae bacterium]